MTLEDILDLVWRRAGDVDQAALRYDRHDVVVELAHVRRSLAVRKNVGFSDYTVTTADAQEAITPEPTDEIGTILAIGTAAALLRRTYAYRVDSGSLGISWSSGLEQESSISAEKAYKAMIDRLDSELEELILIRNSNIAGTRPQ